jgi:hypothetical protein
MPIAQYGGQFGDVQLAVAGTTQRPRQLALQQALVAQTRAAAVLGKLLIMNRKNKLK